VEVLSRLHREARDDGSNYSELWRPASFMPLAERYDLGYALDRRVIARAIEWLEAHPLMQPRLKMISFNLSASSMLNKGFAQEIASQIQSSLVRGGQFLFRDPRDPRLRLPGSRKALLQCPPGDWLSHCP